MLKKFSSTLFSIGCQRYSTRPALQGLIVVILQVNDYFSDGPDLSFFIKKNQRIPKVFPPSSETDAYLTPDELDGQGRTGKLRDFI